MIILTREQITGLLKEAISIVETADFGVIGHYDRYGVAAFKVILMQLFEDAKTGDKVE